MCNTSISENCHDEGDELRESIGLEFNEHLDCSSYGDVDIFKEEEEN